MTYVGLAPRGTPVAALDALHVGFEAASSDPETVNEAIMRDGLPFTFFNVCARAGDLSLADGYAAPEMLSSCRRRSVRRIDRPQLLPISISAVVGDRRSGTAVSSSTRD